MGDRGCGSCGGHGGPALRARHGGVAWRGGAASHPRGAQIHGVAWRGLSPSPVLRSTVAAGGGGGRRARGLMAAVSHGADLGWAGPHPRRWHGSMAGLPPPVEAAAGAGANGVAEPGSLPCLARWRRPRLPPSLGGGADRGMDGGGAGAGGGVRWLMLFFKKCLPSVLGALGKVFAECPTKNTRQNSVCR